MEGFQSKTFDIRNSNYFQFREKDYVKKYISCFAICLSRCENLSSNLPFLYILDHISCIEKERKRRNFLKELEYD